MWYNSGHQGWGSKAVGRNTSIVDAELTPSSPIKPSAGRIIRIINNMDQSVQVKIGRIKWPKPKMKNSQSMSINFLRDE